MFECIGWIGSAIALMALGLLVSNTGYSKQAVLGLFVSGLLLAAYAHSTGALVFMATNVALSAVCALRLLLWAPARKWRRRRSEVRVDVGAHRRRLVGDLPLS